MKRGVKRFLFPAAALLLLLYTVAGFWIIPSVAAKKIPPIASSALGTDVSFGKLSLNPYTMELTVPDLTVKDKNGKNLLYMQEIYLNFSPLDSLLTLSVQIEALRFKKAVVNIALESDGKFNFSNILEHLQTASSQKKKPKTKTERSLPPIRLKQLAIESSEVFFKDFTTEKPVTVSATNLNFGIENLATLPGKKGTMVFEIETKNTAYIHSYSDISLDPFEIDGEIVVSRARLNKFDEYLKRYTYLGIQKGDADLFVSYRVSQTEAGLDARIRNGSFLSVQDFVLNDRGSVPARIGRFDIDGISLRWPSRNISIENIKLDDTDLLASLDEAGRFSFQKWMKAQKKERSETAAKKEPSGEPWHIGVGRVEVSAKAALDAPRYRIDTTHDYLLQRIVYDTNGSLRLPMKKIAVKDVALYDKAEAKKRLSIAGTVLENGLLSLPEKRLDIESLRIEAPKGSVTLLPGGDTNLQRLFASKATPTDTGKKAKKKRQKRKQKEAAPFKITLKRFGLENGSVDFEDRTLPGPHTLSRKRIDATMKEFAYPQKKAAPFTLSFKTPKKGALQAKGRLLIDPLKSDLKLKCSRVALTPYLPYIQKFVNIDMPTGSIGLDASVSYNDRRKPKAKIDYGFTVEDIRIDHSLKKERLFSLKRLKVSSGRLQLFPDNMKVGKVLIEAPYARIHIAKDHTTNLDNLLKKSGNTPAKKSKGKKEEKKSRFNFTVTEIKIKKGNSDFSDLSLPLPFKTHIHDLEGDALGISNLPGNIAKIALKGIVDRYGMAKIDATLITEDPLKKSEIDVDFRNLDVTNLSPYTGKYIGYAIKEGRLWMKLNYFIDAGKLKSENKIVLKKLELGEKIESNESINAPIHLALALLKDSNGVIDLDIPIEGNVTDPKFKIGKVVWQAIGNMITGIVTAPFRFLGSILGIKGEALQYVNFEPGSDAVDPTEREKLDKLAEALKQRPLLALGLKGVYQPQADTKAIREIELKQIIIEKLGKKRVENIQKDVTARMLEKLYTARSSDEALSKLKTTYKKRLEKEKKKPDEREYVKILYSALLKTIDVDKNALEQLAQNRAERIAAYLLSRNIEKERIEIGEPKAVEKLDETGLVPLKLELEAKKE
ncbi:DUF748 domain-containing protein [Hydrogenimonas sp.]